MLRDLPCKRIQVDEIWAFCYLKAKNVPRELRGVFGHGDVYTWVAIDADTKLVPSYLVGLRDSEYAQLFISDLASRHVSNRMVVLLQGQEWVSLLSLKPIGHGAHGRTGFLIHGDSENPKHAGHASDGCIILPLEARKAIWETNDRMLYVQFQISKLVNSN